MDDLSTDWMIGALVVLLVLSAFFSIAETAMMAFNRYRLRHLVARGDSGAVRVAESPWGGARFVVELPPAGPPDR